MYFSAVLLTIALQATNVVSYSPNSYSFNPLEHLAGTAPPFDPRDPATDPAPPQGCKVTRAAYLSRHAAIYANDFEYEEYMAPFVQKLANISVNWASIPSLSFLSTWKVPFTLSEMEMLTRAGKLEATNLGVSVAQRYQSLRTPKKIWTSTAARTVKSAQSFANGLADEASDIEIVQVFEGKNDSANSLTPYKACPAYDSNRGSDQFAEFKDVYAKPITARFNSMAPAFNFTAEDVYGMALLCGYETVIRGSSPFCDLSVLSPTDWLGFEYQNDLFYYYNSGYGNDVSGAIGFPWVNATFNALMGEQNKASNASADQDLFISFTHRELPPTVIVALGLFNNSAYSGANNINATMPLNTINYGRAWKSSEIVPFLTNLAIEKMECESFGYDAGTYYRVLVNNSPQDLISCTGGPGTSCKEEQIQNWLKERAEVVGSYVDVCAVDYLNGTDVLSIYQ
ncbi:hypothetical protein NHQ30_005696 [Ciborinia camelliae]|nr:hypothetical protein NHQ30_005696 [Ciborinia camelliae]